MSSSFFSTSSEAGGQRHFSYTKMTLDGNFHLFSVFSLFLSVAIQNDTTPFCSIWQEASEGRGTKNEIFYSRPEQS